MSTEYSRLLSATAPEDADGQSAQEEEQEEEEEEEVDNELEGKKPKKVKKPRDAAARRKQKTRRFIRSLVGKITDRALTLAEKRFREVRK